MTHDICKATAYRQSSLEHLSCRDCILLFDDSEIIHYVGSLISGGRSRGGSLSSSLTDNKGENDEEEGEINSFVSLMHVCESLSDSGSQSTPPHPHSTKTISNEVLFVLTRINEATTNDSYSWNSTVHFGFHALYYDHIGAFSSMGCNR